MVRTPLVGSTMVTDSVAERVREIHTRDAGEQEYLLRIGRRSKPVQAA